jgi:hypothetical protein
MPIDIRKQLPSGRVRHLGSSLTVPPKTKIALYLLGSSPGFLARVLSSRLFRVGQIRAVVAPRLVHLGGRSTTLPNPGRQEAADAVKLRLVQRLALAPTDLRGVSFALDLTPACTAAAEYLATLPPAQRHTATLQTLAAAALPAPGYDLVITILEMTVGAESVARRLGSVAGPSNPVDQVLRELVTGGLGLVGIVRDPSLLLLLSPDGTSVVRLDPADKVTAGRGREVAFLGALEHLYAGVALTPEETVAVTPVVVEGETEPPAVAPPADAPSEAMHLADVLGAPDAPPPVDPAVQREVQRREVLREAQASAPFPARGSRASTLGTVLAGPASTPLEVAVAPGDYLNPGVNSPRFDAISSSYLRHGHYDRDVAAVVASLSRDPDVPVFIEGVTRENASDAMTSKETMAVSYRDARGRAGSFRVDLPLFSSDGYVRVDGVRYTLTKQVLPLPVIKVRPDEVVITTAYNKATVSRFGQTASSRSAYIHKLAVALDKIRPPGVTVELGSAAAANADETCTVEYNDIARTVRSIRAGGAGYIFSLPALEKELAHLAPWSEGALDALAAAGGQPLGWRQKGAEVLALDGDGVLLSLRDGVAPVPAEEGMDDAVYGTVEAVAPGVAAAPGAASQRSAISRVRLLSQYLPVAVVCGFCDGLIPMLRKAGILFEVRDGSTSAPRRERGAVILSFSDCRVACPVPRLRDSLLVNGLQDVDTAERPLSEYGPGGLGWAEHIADRLGSPGHAKALRNFQASFIDPKTRELLKAEKIPADLSGLLLYASSLLESNQHREANDLANYRLRGPEMVPAILYKALHKEMERARATRGSSVPKRLSLPQNEVIRQMLAASNMEESADLNPLLELETRGMATWTGAAGGLTDSRVATRALRAYHPSMAGVFGYYTPDNTMVGVKRSLTFGTGVIDTNGRFGTGPPPDAGAPRLLAAGELLSAFTSQHSDPARIGMQSKQGTHTLPIGTHTPLLVGSGAERSLAHAIGQTFAWKSEAPGRVGSVDTSAQLAKLDYDDGKVAYIDLSARSVKNSGGGCHIGSLLTPLTAGTPL